MTKILGIKRINIIIPLLLIYLFIPNYFGADNTKIRREENHNIYLLNSGLVDCESASVEYILWTEDSNEARWLENQMPISGLNWHKQELKNYYGQSAYKFNAYKLINKESEKNIDFVIKDIEKRIAGSNIKLYIEERVASFIDLERYVQQSGIEFKDIMTKDNISSMDAYYSGKAGKKQNAELINMQILTRDRYGTDQAQTLLAIPVVIGEF